MNPTLENKIRSSLVKGRLLCETAFVVARELHVTPKEVGEAAEEMNIKITGCQLGVFPKHEREDQAGHHR